MATADQVEARAREIVAAWEKVEREDAERRAAHEEWVTYMVEVENMRPESLPCVHGTTTRPDQGQACGACEAEGEDRDDRTPAERHEDMLRAARAQAEQELAPVKEWNPLRPL